MPLFHYVCRDCGQQCEILVRNGEAPVCPGCSSTRLVKQLSAFAPVGAKTPEPVGCGAPSCCQLQGGGCVN